MAEVKEHSDQDDLEKATGHWNQGDCILGDMPALWGFDRERPITATSLDLAAEAEPILGISIAGESVHGLVVVSQTCDIRRDYHDRPYLQVAPLVKALGLQSIRLRMQPNYAYLPLLEGEGLVADLDRIFSVEKSLLLKWKSVPSCATEEQKRSFAETIQRYYSRPALPNDFVKGIRELGQWVKDKHDKMPTPSKKPGPAPFHPGKCLQALEMFMVRVSPSWDSPTPKTIFILVRKTDEDGISGSDWDQFMLECQQRVSLPPRYTSEWADYFLRDLPAKVYFECDVLDFGYLSDSTRRT